MHTSGNYNVVAHADTHTHTQRERARQTRAHAHTSGNYNMCNFNNQKFLKTAEFCLASIRNRPMDKQDIIGAWSSHRGKYNDKL